MLSAIGDNLKEKFSKQMNLADIIQKTPSVPFINENKLYGPAESHRQISARSLSPEDLRIQKLSNQLKDKRAGITTDRQTPIAKNAIPFPHQ